MMDRLRFWRDQQRTNRHSHIQDPQRRRRKDLHTIDNAGFQWRVVFVAGIGFFADGYTLFSSNFALPMIGYVYWGQDPNSDHQTGINSVTLNGCVVGQIVLGILADVLGRKKIVWLGACDPHCLFFRGCYEFCWGVGQRGKLHAYHSLTLVREIHCWRGDRGGSPVDSCYHRRICPKDSSCVNDGHGLSDAISWSAFCGCGQHFAAVVSIIAISTVPNHFSHPHVAVDSMWRWIYGVGAIFPAIALLLRMTIPESPRFTFDVLNNPNQATNDTGVLLARVFRRHLASAQDTPAPENGQENGPRNQQADTGEVNVDAAVEQNFPPKRSWEDFVEYFFICGNWRYLLGTMGTWFLMDFAFFGLGLNSPQIVSTVWNGELSFTAGQSLSWYSDPTQLKEGELPYNDFRNNAIHFLIIVSIGAVTGSLILVWLVNHISRKKLILLEFFVLAILFFIVGGIFSSNAYSPGTQILVAVFYGLCQFFFNLGPNGLTFMFPAEIFPTRYRCSLYGISAAAGKLGSVVAQGALSRIQFDRRTGGQREPQSLGHVLFAFGAVMLLDALTACFLREVQQSDDTRQSISLEQLAEGRPQAVSNGSVEMQRGAAALSR